MFFSLLVIMFVSASIALTPGAASRALADSSLSAADSAARGGVDWARTRISQQADWQGISSATYSMDGLSVTEGNGTVTGWVRGGSQWGRFRLRFNYQDGPSSSDQGSDGMPDPPVSAQWSDLPFVSCNNLQGGGNRTLPFAGPAISNAGLWSTVQNQIPANSLFLSVEGASGAGVITDASGLPAGFSGSTIYKKTVQTVLRFEDNQPILDGAVCSAGNLSINAYGSNSPSGYNITLNSANTTNSGQVARLRTKTSLNLNAPSSANSTNGELRWAGGLPSTLKTGQLNGITSQADSASNFYQIALNKVRQPAGTAPGVSAGVYVAGPGGLTYYDMNYSDYKTAFAVNNAPPTGGTPLSTLPTGWSYGPGASGGPSYALNIASDVKVVASGTATTVDFAIVPQAGAQSSLDVSYDATHASNTLTTLFGSTLVMDSLLGGASSGSDVPFTTQAHGLAWTQYLQALPGSQTNPNGSVTWTSPDGAILTTTPGSGSNPGSFTFSGWTSADGSHSTGGYFQTALQSALNPAQDPLEAATAATDLNLLLGAYSLGSYSALPSPPQSGLLSPTQIQTNLGAASGQITVQNMLGSIIIGTQVQGNGAAVVSSGNISMIGSSSTLTNTPGSSMGLDIYAQGSILINPYTRKPLPSGAGVVAPTNFQGVLYAWKDIDIMNGNSTVSAPFNLTGAMIAYGGNPANSVIAGGSNVTINAQVVNITFDPSFIQSLESTGPFALGTVSWYEF
jgi:hypothetical protein